MSVTEARFPAGAAVDAAAVKVFVHLASNKDAAAWKRAHEAGILVGLNDPTPYGYGRAERIGCRVRFSTAAPEGPLGKLWRLAIRAATGFDYLHARRQGRALREADVIWTHTESQFLAVAAVLGSARAGPKLLGQSVWLFDRWPRLSPLHRALYRRLIERVDVLTVHSTENLAVARQLFPHKRVELVPYGIASEQALQPTVRPVEPLRILAPGSDRHRDWASLVDAVRGQPGMEARILSGVASPRLARGVPNLRVAPARSNAELREALAWATLVCVPLLPNKHASGITVIQEAVLAGVPVVASDAGGVAGYFGGDEITLVAPQDPDALRAAFLAVAADPEAARRKATRAQLRMTSGGLGAESYVRRHVELSRELLA